MKKPVPGSYIDTQGMGAPLSEEERKKLPKQEFKPATVRPRRLFTETFVEELKILINEVLDERDGKSGVAYFDTEHFKHYVGEDEASYECYK